MTLPVAVLVGVWVGLGDGVRVILADTQSNATDPTSAPATRPAPFQVSVPDLGDLLERLGATTRVDRDLAQERLTQLGMVIAPNLREHLARSDDPEVRDRIEQILAALDQQQLRQPQRVTIDLRQATAFELARAIGEAFGLSLATEFSERDIRANPRFSKQVGDIRWDNVTWFQATDRLFELTGLTVTMNLSRQGAPSFDIRPVQGRVAEGRVVDAALARVTARAVNFSWNQRIVEQGNPEPAGQRTLDVVLGVELEPRVSTTGVGSAQLRITEATDSNGNSLLKKSGKSGMQNLGIQGAFVVRPQLAIPDSPGQRIASLKGVIAVSVPSAFDHAELVGLVPNQSFSAVLGGVAIEDVSIRQPAPGRVTLQAIVNSQQIRAIWQDHDELEQAHGRRFPVVELIDANGVVLKSQGMGVRSVNATHAKFTHEFQRQAGRVPAADRDAIAFPLSAKLSMPSSLVTVELPFEFTDLPMWTEK